MGQRGHFVGRCAWSVVVAFSLLSGAARIGAPAAEPARDAYHMGVAEIAEGAFCDVDSGAVGGGDATTAEVEVRDGSVRFLRPRRLNPACAAMCAQISPAPWSELTTTDGRLAAVQILRSKAPFAVRWITAPRGVSVWSPAPGNALCLGETGRIDVWFDPIVGCSEYRVERRTGPDAAYEALATVKAPPFADRGVEPGVRYGYRIAAVAEDGRVGIPAEVQGTTASRGVFRTTVRLKVIGDARRFDLLRGVLDNTHCDVEFKAGFGSYVGAKILDHTGLPLFMTDLPDAGRSGFYEAPAESPVSFEVLSGAPFFVPLRGGGCARGTFRFELAPGARDQDRVIRMDFVVDPDHAVIGRAARLTARRVGAGGTRVELKETDNRALGEVEVLEADGSVLRTLRAVGSTATDDPPAGEVYRVYRAAANGAHGERLTPGDVVLDERPAGITSGEFELRRGQSFSFAKRAECPIDASDLTFVRFSADMTIVSLTSPGGIASVNDLTDWRRAGTSVPDLFASLVVSEPGVKLRRSSDGDGRTPECDVFVLRCRSGGWARLAIVGRTVVEDRALRSVKFIYAHNPREPVFDADPRVAQSSHGLKFSKFVGERPLGK